MSTAETLSQTPSHYCYRHFSVFRWTLGVYLAIHFSTLIPYSAELYSDIGMLSDPQFNLTYGYFPNLLNWLSLTWQVQILLVISVFLSLGLALNRWPRIIATLLFYVLHCLYHRNNLTHHLGLNYTGWLLLVIVATPPAQNQNWKLPPILYLGGWMIFGLSYTLSGLDKLQNPNWTGGLALYYIVRSPETSAGWPQLVLWLPDNALKMMNWWFLSLEILALPLTFFKFTRRLIWFGLLSMHLGIMLVMGFYDLTAGILCFYLFLMDPELSHKFQRIVCSD